MKRYAQPFVLFFVLLAGLSAGLTSCDDYDKFTADASCTLWFSVDTVRFDTLLTTVGSTTKTVKVFNPNDKGVRIASVRLAEGSDSRFRVNVDGEALLPDYGNVAYDFEVRGGDSLYVRVEVTLPDRDSDEAFTAADALVFALESGVEQRLPLKAIGRDAYHWQTKEVTADTALTAGRPFVIRDSLVVASGATLTLHKGVQLYFHDGAGLIVHGTLHVLGTVDSAVVFRGDRTDRMFDYLPYDNTPSRWGGIYIAPESRNNRFCYADIHSASYGILCHGEQTDEEMLRVENSILHNIGGVGAQLMNCRTTWVNTQVSNTLGNGIWQVGGWVELLHCTLAQFYPWKAQRGAALYLTNYQGDTPCPLLHAHYVNCLITGYSDDVIQGALDEDDEQPLDYYFGYSYLNTAETDDANRFVSVVYDTDEQALPREKNFRRFDTYNFLYDFRLKETSGARNIGDPSVAIAYPFDRYGVSRLADEGPDAGCYEYQPPVEP